MSNKKYIQINVDNNFLDFKEENLNLQLTFKNPCGGGFGTIRGNSSERSQTLPATKKNNEVFDDWAIVGKDNSTTGPIEKDAEIMVNGLTIFNGKAQMKKVSTRGGVYRMRGDEYSVAFFSSNADWLELLGGKELGRDLDWTVQQHIYTRANIVARFNALPVNLYCYTVLKLKDWAVDSATRKKMVDVFSCTPAVFIGTFLDKIFNSIGYSVTSSFFSNAVNSRYVMPVLFPEKYPQEFSEDYLNVAATKNVLQNMTPSTLGRGVPFDVQTKTPPLAIPNPLVLSTPGTQIVGVGNVAQYTAPYEGFYKWDLSATIANITGNQTINFTFFGIGGGVSPNTGQAINITPADAGTYKFSGVMSLEQGAVVETYFYTSAFSLDITAATLEIIGEASITKDSLIDFKYLLRDWKITDFLKGITAAFNLCFETDTNLKIVTIETSDDYLLTSRALATTTLEAGFHQNTTTDSTPKQDLSKKGQVKNIDQTQETQYYKWKNDSADATMQGLNLNEDVELGGCKYDFPLNRFKSGIKQNENPFFSPTVMFFDEEIRHNTSEIVPLIPLFWPEDYRENTAAEENTTEFNPRLLWFGGQRGIEDGEFDYIDTFTGNTFNGFIPACFFVNYNDASGLDVSLSYSDRTIQGNLVKGHLRRFYLHHLARLRHGKRVEMFVYWTELDILQLSFQNKVLINQDMYILEEINSFDPIIDSTTKTILLYDFGPEQQDVDALDNTIALGVLSDYAPE